MWGSTRVVLLAQHLLVPRAIKADGVVSCGDKGLRHADFDFNHGVSSL